MRVGRRLLTRIEKLEGQAGQREQKVYTVIWHESQETEQEALARFLAECPGREIAEADLLVFILEQPGCPELKRRGKGHSP